MEPLYNEEGLIRYIMSCCQAEGGGLRDKPDMSVDKVRILWIRANSVLQSSRRISFVLHFGGTQFDPILQRLFRHRRHRGRWNT